LKVDSSPKESLLKNSGEENNNNSPRHNQNNHQAAEAQSFSSAPKDAAQVPVPNNGIGKPVQESVDNSTNEQSSDNNKIELNPKPAIQETNILSKEKIVTETRSLNETVKTIRSSEIVKELTNFVKSGETQTVTFKVVPENLGRIKVSLDVADHIAKATIEVETETVKQIVQSNIESLKQALTHSGITVDAINVSLTGNQQRHNRPVDSKRKMNDSSDENKIETDSDALLRKNLGYNTYEYLI
jgi:flagellar hook-length control protein FliK